MKKQFLIFSSVALLCLPGCSTVSDSSQSHSEHSDLESTSFKDSHSIIESSMDDGDYTDYIYQIYVDNKGSMPYSEWLQYAYEESGLTSFKGLSPYQTYIAIYKGYSGSQDEWLNDVDKKSLSILVSFDCDDGVAVDSVSLLKGERIDLSKKTTSKPGYKMYCWLSGGIPCNSSFSSMEDVVLTVLWTKVNYVITYYLEGKEYYKSEPGDYKEPSVSSKTGYEFSGWYLDEDYTIPYNGIPEDAEDSFSLYGRFDYMDCNMPIVSINTEDGSDITSRYEYKGATISIDNADKYGLSNVVAEVRGRGNSTWSYSKKPYRIKFDKKQGLFGCEKAKNWVLLADYLDPSSIRNYSALTFANSLPGLPYKYLTKHVRLYLNGKYKGLYLLTQNPDAKAGRVGIEQTITASTDVNTLDYMVEFDQSVRENNVDILDVNYFISTGFSNKEISLKYPEIDDFANEEQFKQFLARVRKEVNDLGVTVNGGKYSEIASKVDEQSLASFTVEDLLTGSRDHQKKSFKFYKKGDKFYFGPAWDYDYSTYVNWTGKPSITTGPNGVIWSYTNICIEKYVSTTEGKKIAGAVWKEMRDSGKYSESIKAIKEESSLISADANMNNNYWYGNNKYDNATAVKNVLDFYDKQTSVMDEYFGV